jgi:two-component system heavy metal sensor histidine kinase CusS
VFGNFSFAETLVLSVSITTAILAAAFWTLSPFIATLLGCVSLSGPTSLFAYRAGRRTVVRSLFALFETMRIPVAERPPLNEDTIPADLRSFSSELHSLVTRFESREAQLKQLSADTSHELRTPLAVIKGKVEIMLSRERDPSYYNARLEEILFHLESMQQIVDSILELSRLSFMGSSEWKEQVDLLLAADEACQFVSYLISGIRKQSLSRSLDFAPTFGNHPLLIRMIVNLIENASKFTPEGGELGVDSGHDLSKSVSFVRIWDHGKGMDEFAIRRCRDLFWRGDASRSSSGYGLGLSLVQRVVEIHGGEMEIESALGKGSSFTVLFPLDTVSLSDYDA